MAKKTEQAPLSSPDEDIMAVNPDSSANDTPEGAAERTAPRLTTLQKMKKQVEEGDDAPASSLRFRDIVGGDFLWTLVRHHVWLIILVGFLTTSYIAVRYQCQQDAIDINQLERDLVDAKFQALSSSSNLTRMSRQGNVTEMLRQHNDTLLKVSSTPPYIIEVK